jgi:hypothetical protein
MRFTMMMPVPPDTRFTDGALDAMRGPTVLHDEVTGSADTTAMVVEARVEDGYLHLSMEAEFSDELMRVIRGPEPEPWMVAPSATIELPRQDEIDEVRRRATGIYRAGGVDLWLSTANRLLGNRTPTQAVEQGDAVAVHRILDILAGGSF